MAVEDIKWLATVGNPQLAQAGVRKLAFIAPRDFSTRMGEDDYARRSEAHLDIRWFTNFEPAKAWLAEA